MVIEHEVLPTRRDALRCRIDTLLVYQDHRLVEEIVTLAADEELSLASDIRGKEIIWR